MRSNGRINGHELSIMKSIKQIMTSLNEKLGDSYLKSMEEAMERAQCGKCSEHRYFYKYDFEHLVYAFLVGASFGILIQLLF